MALSTDDEILTIFSTLGPGELPIGVYMVRPDGEFLFASPEVRRLLHLPMDGHLRGISLAEFYRDRDEREKFLRLAENAHRQGHYLDGEILHLQVNGRDIFAEDFCKPLYHPENGEIMGYYGCLIDRTDELKNRQRVETLREKVEELTIDIGRVLHANTTTLVMVKHALAPTLDLMRFEQNLGDEDILAQSDQLLQRSSAYLVRTIQRLFESTDEKQRIKALPQLRWEYLEQLLPELRDYRDHYAVEDAHPAMLRLLAKDVVEITQEIKSGYLARELVRDVQRAALDLQRMSTLIPVQRAYDAVIQMDHSIQALREFVTSDMRAEEQPVILSVSEVLDQAIANLNEFAKSQQVDVKKKEFCRHAKISCSERDFQRTLSNLLHNAIKYTWSRTRGRGTPWVSVEIRCVDNEVNITFENWGVPVARDEIEQGLVFGLGYRGRHSRDRSRLGTGVGLTDALRVAKQCGGTITMTSRPATSIPLDENDPAYYSHPFITRVTLTLPRA